ncbi:hypothetical protein MTR67_026088 [Solanum verrucosum]|uniref:Integrase catalytic domain-containing protein n=1 Tax=Solanum verrucosum TaxID=315347 RepID=A0AAF0R240_SOLVR|nr:hypothetical protein MTR67_026088 [Solanum verrucosum]
MLLLGYTPGHDNMEVGRFEYRLHYRFTPHSSSVYSIWVTVDQMMKSTHFLPIKTLFFAGVYAMFYIKEIVRLRGVPFSIVSDRCTQYTSQFRKSFQKGLGTQVKLSMNFHHQSDGQAERTIQTLKYMFRACGSNFKGNLDDH